MSQRPIIGNLDAEQVIRERLGSHVTIDCDEITIRVRMGTAYIGGCAFSRDQKKLIDSIVSSVEGIDSVVSTLRIAPQTTVSDSALRDRILRRIAGNTQIDHTGIFVTVVDQVARLEGSVSTWEKRCLVESEAVAAGGAAMVVNYIETPSHPHAVERDSAESVSLGLVNRLGIETSAIDVAFSDGTIYLTGVIPSAGLKDAAEDLARWTPRVTDVVSDLNMPP